MEQSEPDISIVVCTYNRAELLKGCLESLAHQSVEESDYEVIIVDNNSTDNTEDIANAFAERYPNFFYVKEANQGLSHARNKGYMEARGKYVAYIDDDARAEARWAELIVEAFEIVTPAPVAVGGKILPWYDIPPPTWFSDSVEMRSWGEEKGFLKQPDAQFGFSGSNMAINKSVLVKYNGFSADYGMLGIMMGFGEEAELFYRIYKEHPLFWYDPAVQVRHRVPAEKMTLYYQIKRSFMAGIAKAGIVEENRLFGIFKMSMLIILKIGILPLRINWLNHNRKRGLLKCVEPVASHAGFLKGLISRTSNR
ncbi:MAG: glycosyltransferase [Deltaproteobacteria bacterium]|nr:glycosyltransferase [Deltaproteobacteria bacterium]